MNLHNRIVKSETKQKMISQDNKNKIQYINFPFGLNLKILKLLCDAKNQKGAITAFDDSF